VRYRGLFYEHGKTISNWLNANFLLFQGIDVFSFFDVPVVLDTSLGGQIGAANSQLTQLKESIRVQGPANIIRAGKMNELGFHVLNILLSQSTVKDSAIRHLIYSERLEQVIAHIHESLHKKIPVETLARIMRLSQSRFFAVFRSTMGVSPQAYVRDQKIRRAQLYLATTDLNVTEVARRVGYDDVFQFSRMFKKELGMSPSAYRERADMIT
jgi:AraC-like DNA-binding protein